MKRESWYTLALLLTGGALGAMAMRYSMVPTGHVRLGKHFATAGAGIAAGATIAHLSGNK